MNSKEQKSSVVSSQSSVKHIPVLLKESIDGLSLETGDIFLDGTLGSGGHSAEVARRFGDSVAIIGLDRDPSAIARAEEVLRPLTRDFRLFNENFRDMDKALAEAGVERVDAVLLDLGISSDQFESSGRGFSFQRDEPLDMRMGAGEVTAADILNNFDEGTLELIIRGFGEERYSRRIAREIVLRRSQAFRTTKDLVDVIMAAIPERYKHGKIHPATHTFRALRIAVNEELTSLEQGLEKGWKSLSPVGRLAVISFHSLEDRLVKNFFRDMVRENAVKLITKKPIRPTEEEVARNPRARSAKLRIIEKIIKTEQ